MRNKVNEDTLNMLKDYTSNDFKEDIRCLTLMFAQLKEHEVPKPIDPIDIKIKDGNGKGVMVASKFEEMVFHENVK